MRHTTILDSDPVMPLRYNESRNAYHVPAFVTPGRLSWFRNHSEDDYYIRSLDVGVYEVGSLRGKKLPNLKKVTVECPDEQFEELQYVSDNILFCPSCAPHKYVSGGEILKKQYKLDGTGRICFCESNDV